MLLTLDSESWDSFSLLLRMAASANKRVLFAYPESEKTFIEEVFQHRLGNSNIEVAMETLFKQLNCPHEILCPIPPLVETHTHPLNFNNKSLLQVN